MKAEVKEIQCKSGLSKCGFAEGSFCINPYSGCGHACVYCYARFMKRFIGCDSEWGTFVFVKKNLPEVLARNMKSPKYKGKLIFIGTVTDAYQPAEKEYKLMRKVLEILLEHQNPVEIITKSDLVLRDLDLIKKFKNITVSFTINSLDETWKKLTEPESSSARERLAAAKKFHEAGVKVNVLMGPLWPYFTDINALFREFKSAGVSHVFTESFNTIGGNWTGVEVVLKKHYSALLPEMKKIMFEKESFEKFYGEAEQKIKAAVKKYKIPCTVLFGMGHERTPKEVSA